VVRRNGAVRRVEWRAPAYHSVVQILHNPIYAGAYAFGRTEARTRVVEGHAVKTSGHRKAMTDWNVLIRDNHEGYIDWETYVGNRKQIHSNRGWGGRMTKGAAKTGAALLSGLLRCARCGRKLHVSYSGNGGRVPRYSCRGAAVNHGVESCISFGGLRVDQAVSAAVLEAVASEGVTASLEAWDQLHQQEDQRQASLRLTLEKAEYEADRARRQYEAVEPENRLVAAELERRWEQALVEVTRLGQRLEDVGRQQLQLTEDHREQLLQLGEDLHRVWDHSLASAALKKRILRTVLEEIVVNVHDDPPKIHMRLHWAGGVHTELEVRRNHTGQHKRCTDRSVVEVVRELAKVCDDTVITAALNRAGYKTGAGNTWTESRVRSLRSYRRIPAHDPAEGTWVTMTQAADKLGVSVTVVKRLLRGSSPVRIWSDRPSKAPPKPFDRVAVAR